MKYKTFADFYPYYLSEHQNVVCRRLHFVGSCLVMLILITSVVSANIKLLLLLPLVGYGFAWVGHFFFEHNRPATFSYPAYSLMGDWRMFWDILRGKIAIK